MIVVLLVLAYFLLIILVAVFGAVVHFVVDERRWRRVRARAREIAELDRVWELSA